MFHIFGLMVTSLPTLHVGGKIITLPKFESDTFIKSLAMHNPTFLHLVPPLVSFLANEKDVKPHHLKGLKHIQVKERVSLPMLARF